MSNQLTALKELAEKVEAGYWPREPEVRAALPYLELGVRDDYEAAHHAYYGSLDAAHALHKAVVLGWTVANLGQDDGGLWWCELRQGYQTSFLRVSYVSKQQDPARAWLLAIIKAKIMESEE